MRYIMPWRLRPSFLVVLLLVLALPACKVGRFFVYNLADTRDHRKFPTRPLPPSTKPYHYAVATNERAPATITLNGRELPFDRFLERSRTVAFLVIQRDTIIHERYFKRYHEGRIHPSFSVAKSFVGALVGCAIVDGLIRSVQQPVTDFVPEMKAKGWDRVTVEQVLQMTSGMDFSESYVNPFGMAATFYYGRHVERSTIKRGLQREPGERFEYVSGNSQLLGLILQRALRAKGDERTVTEYLHERLWAPMGMEHPSSWSIDRKGGMEKAFCCINTPARDFAKLGSLFLHGGMWNGQRILPQEWVARSTQVDTTQGSAAHYQYQWWLPSRNGDFMAQGILGQYVYVDPARELVIVRLGKQRGGVNWWTALPALARSYPLGDQ